MKAACPSCGAEIEFRYDDSFVRVCSYCRAAVLRSDRGLDSLGKVADLVPMDSPLRLFADGRLGNDTFILVGMAQLRHQAGGLTQEWYARFSAAWGWLAEAQGRYYMTYEVEGAKLPELESLEPGTHVQLPTMLGVQRRFTVAEVGSSTYVAANGELPFKLVPNGSYRFADLSDGEGNFATIDYGEPGDTPTLYTGKQVTLEELGIHGGEVGPSREPTGKATRLGCPTCNAPIDLVTATQAQRVVCGNCNTLLDVSSGAAQAIEKLKRKPTPRIPLGTKGKFLDGELTVIGFVQRSAQIEGQWYPFEEYLLYAPEVGFRWLVDSDGHWSYVQPVDIGAIEYEGTQAKYDGVKFKLFQSSDLRVDTVLGEFYWQVKVGEVSRGNDFVAPPAMLSREEQNREETWSLSTYMKPAEVERAFGDSKDIQLGPTSGVAPNQPDPTAAASTPLALGFVALIVLGIVFAARAPKDEKLSTTMSIPSGTAVAPAADAPVDPNAPNVFFSDPFQLDGDKNIELAFRANLNNNWAYVVASLVNVGSGQVTTIDASMEHYSGYEDGESWSEGADHDTEVVGPVTAGQYVLRIEGQQGATAGEVPVSVRVRQGVFRGRYLGLALGVLGIPFLFFGIWGYSFERRRWSNSTEGSSGAPKTPLLILVGGIALVFGGIFALIKAAGDNDD